jgi:hypothetical protein
MMSINPVHFNSVKKKNLYRVNSQFLRSFRGPRGPLGFRIDCTLKAISTTTSRIPGNSYIEFICVKPIHSHRFCATQAPVKISQQVFQTGTQSTGNVLIRMYPDRCHACGERSDLCWLEYTGHFVCNPCVEGGKGVSPYPYGTTDRKCCVEDGCGSALTWYGEADLDLLARAVTIYERYRTP